MSGLDIVLKIEGRLIIATFINKIGRFVKTVLIVLGLYDNGLTLPSIPWRDVISDDTITLLEPREGGLPPGDLSIIVGITLLINYVGIGKVHTGR